MGLIEIEPVPFGAKIHQSAKRVTKSKRKRPKWLHASGAPVFLLASGHKSHGRGVVVSSTQEICGTYLLPNHGRPPLLAKHHPLLPGPGKLCRNTSTPTRTLPLLTLLSQELDPRRTLNLHIVNYHL